MRLGAKRLMGFAAAVSLAALLSTTGAATAQISSGNQFKSPCQGTWWIERGDLELGAKLPEFGFSKCDGKEVTTSDLEGRPLLINFWATWCGPCREELPELNDLAEQAGDDLTVIGVSIDRDPDQLRDFVKQTMLKYDITWDGGGIARDLGINAIPLTIAVDADGNVVGGHQGYATEEQFRKLAELAGADLPDDSDNS